MPIHAAANTAFCFQYVLVGVDAHSKEVRLQPMMSMNSATVVRAMTDILQRFQTPSQRFDQLVTDRFVCQPQFRKCSFAHFRGTEFTNHLFQQEIVDKFKLQHILTTPQSKNKSFIAENRIRLIRRLLKRIFLTGKLKNIALAENLPDALLLVEKLINNTKGTKYNIAPAEVHTDPAVSEQLLIKRRRNHAALLDKYYARSGRRGMSPRYQVNDVVRLLLFHTGTKESLFRKTEESPFASSLYRISAVKQTGPEPRYKLTEIGSSTHLSGTFPESMLLRKHD